MLKTHVHDPEFPRDSKDFFHVRKTQTIHLKLPMCYLFPYTPTAIKTLKRYFLKFKMLIFLTNLTFIPVFEIYLTCGFYSRFVFNRHSNLGYL